MTSPAKTELSRAILEQTRQKLVNYYGPQHNWWPAAGRFDLLIGALLTQNTQWHNVELAIARMQSHGDLEDPAHWGALSDEDLAALIRPSGYYRQKSKRLKGFCQKFLQAGGWATLDCLPQTTLQQWLLSIDGIGQETAASMLLYAFKKPAFVIDKYSKRLFTRLGYCLQQTSNAFWQSTFERLLPADVESFSQYHALIVNHAKRHCRSRPLCSGCPLATSCSSTATQ